MLALNPLYQSSHVKKSTMNFLPFPLNSGRSLSFLMGLCIVGCIRILDFSKSLVFISEEATLSCEESERISLSEEYTMNLLLSK